MKDCPDCMEDENAIGQGVRCGPHEIAFLRAELEKANFARTHLGKNLDAALLGHRQYVEKAESEAKRQEALAQDAYSQTLAMDRRRREAEAEVAALKAGKCVCWQEPGSTERQHAEHCPEQAALLMRWYCDRIKALKAENARMREATLLEAIEEAEKPRTVFLTRDGLEDWDRIAAIRKQMRSEIVKALRAKLAATLAPTAREQEKCDCDRCEAFENPADGQGEKGG